MNCDHEMAAYNPGQVISRLDPESKLNRYYHLLLKENERVNLVSRETLSRKSGVTPGGIPEGLLKLGVESLVPIENLQETAFENYLDIGSGGGFPAVPILLLYRVGHACMVERTQKKAGALRRILLALEKRAEIRPESFEQCDLGNETFDLVTLRQVKLTPALLGRILSLLAVGGVFVYYSRYRADSPMNSLAARVIEFRSDAGSSHWVTFFYK